MSSEVNTETSRFLLTLSQTLRCFRLCCSRGLSRAVEVTPRSIGTHSDTVAWPLFFFGGDFKMPWKVLHSRVQTSSLTFWMSMGEEGCVGTRGCSAPRLTTIWCFMEKSGCLGWGGRGGPVSQLCGLCSGTCWHHSNVLGISAIWHMFDVSVQSLPEIDSYDFFSHALGREQSLSHGSSREPFAAQVFSLRLSCLRPACLRSSHCLRSRLG